MLNPFRSPNFFSTKAITDWTIFSIIQQAIIKASLYITYDLPHTKIAIIHESLFDSSKINRIFDSLKIIRNAKPIGIHGMMKNLRGCASPQGTHQSFCCFFPMVIKGHCEFLVGYCW